MNNQLKRKKEHQNIFIRWVLFALIIIVAYISMCITKSAVFDAIVLIPVAISIAMYNSPFVSAITGCVCGLLIDSATGTVFGYHAIMLMWICAFTSLFFMFVLRKHFLNMIMITAISTTLILILDYLFIYVIWGYDRNGGIFLTIILPCILLTVVISIPVFFIIKAIVSRFGKINETFAEEKTDDIVRE